MRLWAEALRRQHAVAQVHAAGQHAGVVPDSAHLQRSSMQRRATGLAAPCWAAAPRCRAQPAAGWSRRSGSPAACSAAQRSWAAGKGPGQGRWAEPGAGASPHAPPSAAPTRPAGSAWLCTRRRCCARTAPAAARALASEEQARGGGRPRRGCTGAAAAPGSPAAAGGGLATAHAVLSGGGAGPWGRGAQPPASRARASDSPLPCRWAARRAWLGAPPQTCSGGGG